MARSSAAVARASDSRCAATWPLAVARRLRRAGGSGPLLAASENWLTALASARCSSAAWRSMPAGSRARSALPRATRRVSTAARRSFELRRVGGAPPSRPPASALHLGEQLLRVGDQLVGDRLGVDLERAVGDRPGRCGRPCRRRTRPRSPPESRVEAVLDSATVALASTAGAAWRGRRQRSWRHRLPQARSLPAAGAGSGLSAGCPIFMGLSKGAPGGPVPSSWTDYRPRWRRL